MADAPNSYPYASDSDLPSDTPANPEVVPPVDPQSAAVYPGSVPRPVMEKSETVETHPTVSVLVLNYNGLRHLETCFTALINLDYPRESLELMLIDNGSGDESLLFMRSRFPDVRIVETGANLGFAAGNNYGAKRATGEYIALLNNDTRVEPDWLSELVKGMVTGRDRGVVCTSSLMLDWSGERIDFQAGALNFHGFGFQPSYGQPVKGLDLDAKEPRDLLFACGGSMLIRRDVYLEVGGLDPDFFAFFEDVDLGWRLWLLGYRIVLVPTAVTYHRHHGTAENIPHHRTQVLYERNALYTIYKNYEETHLQKILPAALLLLGQRAVRFMELGGVNLDDYDLSPGQTGQQDTENVHRNAVASLLAATEFGDNTHLFRERRSYIQANRKRSDAEIFAMFGQPGRVHLLNHTADAPYAAAHYNMLNEFEIGELWSDLPKEVLVISPDVLPVGDIAASGSGIRAWALGKGLESRGHHVHFTMPAAALVGREEMVPAAYTQGAWTAENLQSIVDAMTPDVVVSCGWPNMTWLRRANVPVALDLTGPHLLERIYQRHLDPLTNAAEKVDGISRGDFFTCIGERQRHYFISWLAQAGVDLDRIMERLRVIPYSLSPEQPEHHWPQSWHAPENDIGVRFLYGGIFLPWQNPGPALTTVAETLEEQGTGRLEIIGGKHPFHAVHTGGFGPLVSRLLENPRVTISDLLPHDKLVERYTRAHVAIDVMMPNAERELAFPSRTVHYFWCGLPVIHAEFSEVAPYIKEYEAGWVVPPDDPRALKRVLLSILADPDEAKRRGTNAQRLASELFSWDKTVTDLANFVKTPNLRPERMRRGYAASASARTGVLAQIYASEPRNETAGTRATAAPHSIDLTPAGNNGSPLSQELKRLHKERRTFPRQIAARSKALLKEFVPVEGSRAKPTKTNGANGADGQRRFALPELVAGHSHGQRFLCEHDGLSGIRLELGTFGRNNTSRLVLSIRQNPGAQADIYRVQLATHRLSDGQPLLFRFPAIPGSANRWFYFVAESPDGAPGDAITFWATYGDQTRVQRYEDGLPASGALVMGLEFNGVKGE